MRWHLSITCDATVGSGCGRAMPYATKSIFLELLVLFQKATARPIHRDAAALNAKRRAAVSIPSTPQTAERRLPGGAGTRGLRRRYGGASVSYAS